MNKPKEKRKEKEKAIIIQIEQLYIKPASDI